MSEPLQSREKLLLAAVGGLLLAAVSGPYVAQAIDYHHFADGVTRWGIPHAADVLSNLAFAAVGLLMAAALHGARGGLPRVEWVMGALASAGLLFTALGSAWYHLAPDDAGLMVDRAAMAIAFAGLLGMAACRASARAGAALGLLALVAGPAAVTAWAQTGNLLPWIVLQSGGLALLLALALVRAPHALPVRWIAVIAIYAVAKFFELGDHAVWEATGEWLSGHTLKHIVAAAAAWPVVSALRACASDRHNRAQLPARAA